MLKQLKKLFGWGDRSADRRPTPSAVASGQGSKPLAAPSACPRPLEAEPATASPSSVPQDEDVSIPLQSVLDVLPPELKGRVIPTELGGATLTLALTKVLSQLPLGAVKLSFGELRRAAPPLFTPGEQADELEVELPLSELLVRIDPALLPRSPTQQVVADLDRLDDTFFPARNAAKANPVDAAPGPIRVPLPGNLWESASTSASSPKIPCAGESGDGFLRVPLASLTGSWPALVQAEIAQLDCAHSQVSLPESLVQAGMRQGKVAFPWKALRSWLNPAPPFVVSNHDDTKLELPLEVLMPLSLALWKQTPNTKRKLVVDETIPALFAPTTPPESGTETVAEETNPHNSGDTKNTTLESTEAEHLRRYISPKEIVARATELKGVDGALVILPEGLLVASSSSTQRPDALAAFLARAFGRVAQSAHDAQVGELSRMEFWADGVHWLILNPNTVLFATFGPTDGSLPVSELAVLARELDPKRES